MSYAFNVFTGQLDLVGVGTSTPTDVITFTKTAAVNLSGQRVVAPRADGTVEYASNTLAPDANRPLWLTLGAALTGNPVTVLAFGIASEVTWTWTFPDPIWLGANGVLTQTVPVGPAAAFVLQVAGPSETPTSLFFDPRTPIIL